MNRCKNGYRIYKFCIKKNNTFSCFREVPSFILFSYHLCTVLLTGIQIFLFRFAQFFLCPLFDESCKDREVNAVDSEHEKNLMNDAWRLFQLEKATGNPNHPFSKFGTGLWEYNYLFIGVLCRHSFIVYVKLLRTDWNNSPFSSPYMFIMVLYHIFHIIDQTELD